MATSDAVGLALLPVPVVALTVLVLVAWAVVVATCGPRALPEQTTSEPLRLETRRATFDDLRPQAAAG